MGLFNKNNGQVLTPRQQLEAKFQNARNDLLIIVAFTIVNLVLLVSQSDSYFVFSAYMPYTIAYVGMYICGKFPIEYYEGELTEADFVGPKAFVFIIAIAVIMTLTYLLCWFKAKNKKSTWLIVGLVLISIDSAFLLMGGVSIESAIDILFHIWMIFSISQGISANKKLKELPEEDEAEFGERTETDNAELQPQAVNTAFKRTAEIGVKNRIFADAKVENYIIIYRRVKRVNELVINGYVYDDVEMLIETEHELKAVIDGHEIVAGFDGTITSYINFDGNQVAKKTRLF